MVIYGLNAETSEAFEQETRLLSFVYLHGALEEKNKYDLIGVTEETYRAITACQFGKFTVDVILSNGEKEHGILFYWHDDQNRMYGLVVSEMDAESMVYARDKFCSRANTI